MLKNSLTPKELARRLATDTSLTVRECETIIKLLIQYICEGLLDERKVLLPHLGFMFIKRYDSAHRDTSKGGQVVRKEYVFPKFRFNPTLRSKIRTKLRNEI